MRISGTDDPVLVAAAVVNHVGNGYPGARGVLSLPHSGSAPLASAFLRSASCAPSPFAPAPALRAAGKDLAFLLLNVVLYVFPEHIDWLP